MHGLHMYVCTRVHYVRTYVHTDIRTYVCLCAHVYVRTWSYLYTCMINIHTDTYMYIRMYVRVHVCTWSYL